MTERFKIFLLKTKLEQFNEESAGYRNAFLKAKQDYEEFLGKFLSEKIIQDKDELNELFEMIQLEYSNGVFTEEPRSEFELLETLLNHCLFELEQDAYPKRQFKTYFKRYF